MFVKKEEVMILFDHKIQNNNFIRKPRNMFVFCLVSVHMDWHTINSHLATLHQVNVFVCLKYRFNVGCLLSPVRLQVCFLGWWRGANRKKKFPNENKCYLIALTKENNFLLILEKKMGEFFFVFWFFSLRFACIILEVNP